MTIIEMMARAIEGQLKPFVILGDSVALEIARAARDALVLGLTEGFVEDLVDNGVIWVIDCDEICWDLPRVRAALLELTEVDDDGT